MKWKVIIAYETKVSVIVEAEDEEHAYSNATMALEQDGTELVCSAPAVIETLEAVQVFN